MPQVRTKGEDCGFAADGCVAPLRKTPHHNGVVFWMGVERKIGAPTQRGEAQQSPGAAMAKNGRNCRQTF